MCSVRKFERLAHRRCECAFSLVEITIALGIAAFATLAIFGLLSVGLDGGRSAANDAAVARISETVLARLKERPFASIQSLSETMDFDESGLEPDLPTRPALYRCVVTTSGFSLPGVLDIPAADSPVRVRMEFFSPPENPQPLDALETVVSRSQY